MRAAALLGTLALAGCAVPHQGGGYVIQDRDICARVFTAIQRGDMDDFRSANLLAEQRGLNPESCARIVTEHQEQQRRSSDGILTGLALLAAASGRPAAPAPMAPLPPVRPIQVGPQLDYEWAWDQFYNQTRAIVWQCRGVQTGQFAYEEKCANKPKLDIRWPGLEFRP